LSIAETALQSIPARFGEVAARYADAPCVVGDFGQWTFAAISRYADALAAELLSAGLRPGDRVGLLCPNGAAFVAAYLGVLKAGGSLVPLNWMLHPKEMAFILQDAGAVALFYHRDLAVQAEDEAIADLRLPIGLALAAEPDVTNLLPEQGRSASARSDSTSLDPGAHPAAILYTSGTTGRPKGAVLTHRNLLSNTAAVAAALALRPGRDRVLVVLPMFHAFAATVGVLTPLLHGLSILPVTRFDPRLVSQAIALHGASVFLGVPSMYQLLLRVADAVQGQWQGVRFAVSGGAALPVPVLEAFEARFGVPILEGDGPTECGPVTCVNPLEGPRKSGSVGLPLPGVAMSIRDSAGRELPAGELGEVCVRGPSVMRGYWGQPNATAEAFYGDWFRTGDLGQRDADGYYYLVDRIKDLIICNGVNLYPRAIEEVLHRHPEVAEVAVVGEAHRLHGEIPIAYLVCAAGAELQANALRAWCRGQLGVHEVPRRFVFREALPRNAAGKVLKRELRRAGEFERGVDLPPGS